jgi:ABC-type amino acid transport substrate-binding protein
MNGAAKILSTLAITLALSGTARALEVEVLANSSLPFWGLEDGKPAGIAVDILNAVTAEGGPSFKFDFSLPWVRSQEKVHTETGLAILFTRTAEREHNHKWIAELFDYNAQLVSVGRAAPFKTLDEAKALQIGIQRGSAFEPRALQAGFTHLEPVVSDDINAKKMVAGRLDGWFASEYVGEYLYANAGGDPATLQIGPKLGDTYHMYIAGDRNFPEADAKAIADGIDRLRNSGKLEAILARYKKK